MPSTAARRARRTRRRQREEEAARDVLVSSSLESVQQCLRGQDYGTAFVHYLLVLSLAPVLKDLARESFRSTLFRWAEELDSLGRVQDLFRCFEQAMELFPSDELIVNSLGEHLFRMGFRDEAAGHFYKALKLRPDFPEAKENFYCVANWLVERWHFLMLNDHARNHKYQLAIQKAVAEGRGSVLDIGTGTGILGMCAKKAGAAQVYACELSKTMFELAREVVSANGMSHSIKIVHLKSLDMEVPRDIPQRVSLVVTETVDAGLFGEGIIESLIHAWKHLLLPPPNPAEPVSVSQTGRVIPAGATVFGVAVQCPEIRRQHRHCASSLGGLDFSPIGQIYSPVSSSPDGEDASEPYTTERLSRLRGGYQQLTEPFTALDINFNHPQELEGLSGRAVTRLRLPVTRDGLLDALALWFQLHLDEDNHLSTGPQDDTCWEQAVYPVQSPINEVRRGDEILLEVSCEDSYLRLRCVAIARDGKTLHELSRHRPRPFLLESSEIALLNNTSYHHSFRQALAKRCQLANTASSRERLHVLDVSEGFSVLPVLAAQLGGGLVRAYSSLEKERHQAALRLLAQANGVQQGALEFWLGGAEHSALLQRPAGEKLWSCIILDCVEICGLLRQKLLEKAALARCLLDEGGHIFPQRIVIHGMLLESDTLLRESAVQGAEPTLGFNIAPYINQFTVPVHMFLDLSTLPCSRLSEPVELFTLDLMSDAADVSSRDVKVRVSASGRVTAVPFWYQMQLDSELSISTFTEDSHWKQAAAVLHKPLPVRAGDWLRLSVSLNKSSVSISVAGPEERRQETLGSPHTIK